MAPKLEVVIPAIIAGASALASAWLAIRKARRRQGSRSTIYRLKNSKGMEVHVSAVGASILKILVPNKQGKLADVVLGYNKPDDYLTKEPVTYFGAIVGRVANRIANAQFSLNGKAHKLLANNGPNALHGGALGLHRRVWEANQLSSTQVILHYCSPDGEEGYPGTLDITVTYSLAADANDLACDIKAVTDQATPVNIVQHSYFNLAGHNSGHDILDHVVHMPSADHYTPVGPTQIPTGSISPVHGTPFDFTTPSAIGARLHQVEGGYDHNFVLFHQGPQARYITQQGYATKRPKLAAHVCDPKSGRAVDVLTTAPGMQFYTGNFLDEKVVGKTQYFKHAGFCMETQAFPDAINQPDFPNVVLQPDQVYIHQVLYKFWNK